MKKLAVCECCGNIFMMGARVWEYRGDKLCSEKCARKAEFLGKQGKWKNDIDKKEKENKKMKEIKLTIDGKEVQLTEEQLRLLEIKGKWSNPFSRVKKDKVFYSVSGNGEVLSFLEDGNYADDELEKCANYFNNKKVATQIALHQLLNRKLLKFAYENEYNDDADWNVRNIHWGIYYDYEKRMFDSDCHGLRKFDGVWFSSKDGADYAIKEVVEPFVKEHPEFVW